MVTHTVDWFNDETNLIIECNITFSLFDLSFDSLVPRILRRLENGELISRMSVMLNPGDSQHDTSLLLGGAEHFLGGDLP